MEYLEIEKLKEEIQQNDDYKRMIEQIKKEVNEFCPEFHDDPNRVSRWGHNYFCEKDGGLLIYDRKKPREHQCEICKEVYDNELLNGVWVYMYRNDAVLAAWKSALLYRITREKKYIEYVEMIIGFYSDHYLEFKLHKKENTEFDSLEEMEWGCGRIMPQTLNEALIIIRMVNTLELVKNELSGEFLESVNDNLFQEAFKLLKFQVNEIHNIPCWCNSAIGVMGLFLQDKEMIDFTFKGEFNIRKQLLQGVTEDGFWYEGSIHYNFFTLEGMTNLLLFCKLYDYDFGEEKNIIRKMFISAYNYAFDNHKLPNPNDGWPNINLKTYSYIYSVATKVFGVDSEIGNLLKNILKKDGMRGQFPLSRPYYYNNEISLERLILIPELHPNEASEFNTSSINFTASQFGIIKDNGINIFYKYGHNVPSHAHPDKMNMEVTFFDQTLTRDLSNSGYGNPLCNEWHRMTASHNTVVVNGKNHSSLKGGTCLEFRENMIDAKVDDVYQGVDFRRKVEITKDGFRDLFTVSSNSINTYDYFFHVEANLLSELELEKSSLEYHENGYQHISNINKVLTEASYVDLDFQLAGYIITSRINLEGKELFIAKSPDNPITEQRTSLIVRAHESSTTYDLTWKIRRS